MGDNDIFSGQATLLQADAREIGKTEHAEAVSHPSTGECKAPPSDQASY